MKLPAIPLAARLLVVPVAFASAALADDAAAIMAKVAANVEAATDARRQFVYRQNVRGSMSKSGQRIRREDRQYSVIPSATSTEKKLVSFRGEYKKGKQTLTYSEPVPQHGDAEHKDIGADAEILEDVTESLVNAKNSRDGIPRELFPLRTADLPFYVFTMKAESGYQGRSVYRIGLVPVKKDFCLHIGEDNKGECGDHQWMGEVWIDQQELQPVRIDTQLAWKVPWAVRTFMGTNLKQLGFAITYKRVAEGVWFPATYGTEFQIDVLFFYKRTISLNLESSGFQKTDAVSTVKYDLTDVH